jgi:hypothetical protein
MRLYLEGVGLRGPGIVDWAAGREILAERAVCRPAEVVLAASELLPAAERRRTTETVKLALMVGSEAMAHAGARPENTPSVFASSGGDGATVTAILEILASTERQVSPTRFHNSVHNAPSGYWSIATHSREASTSICAHDFSFEAGLLEAAGQAVAEQCSMLLVSYELPYPSALHAVRPIFGVFGIALVLSPRKTARSLAALAMEMIHDHRPETAIPQPELEALRTQNPAARALPLLAAVAQGLEREVVIRHVAGNLLAIRVTPMAEPTA